MAIVTVSSYNTVKNTAKTHKPPLRGEAECHLDARLIKFEPRAVVPAAARGLIQRGLIQFLRRPVEVHLGSLPVLETMDTAAGELPQSTLGE